MSSLRGIDPAVLRTLGASTGGDDQEVHGLVGKSEATHCVDTFDKDVQTATKWVTKVTNTLAELGKALGISPAKILEAIAKLEDESTPMVGTANDVANILALSEVPSVLPSWGCIDVPQVSAWLFDWDDNILNMRKSNIYLYHKETGEELAVPTDVYAQVRGGIGYDVNAPIEERADSNRLDQGSLEDINFVDINPEQINWSCFAHKADDRRFGSFRDFDDLANPTQLDEEVDAMLAIKNYGPVWNDFILACSNPVTAQFTCLITARGHSPESFHRVLKNMQKRGIIQYVPPKENLYPCSHKDVHRRLGIEGDPGSVSQIKLVAITKIIERIQNTKLGDSAINIRNKDGDANRPMHIIGFSDDDSGNEKKTQEGVGALIRENPELFDRIKLTTFGTAAADKRMKVIKSDGSLRDVHPAEMNEAWLACNNNSTHARYVG